jgi:hypothetical protein
MITSSYLVGACTGRSAGIAPEDAIDVRRRALILFEYIGAIGN